MEEKVIRPNRHSHSSKGVPMRWPKKTVEAKVWPKPKFTPVDVDLAKLGINPDEENARADVSSES